MNTRYHDQTFNEILIGEGLISSVELARLLGERDNAAEPVGDMLVRLGILTEKDRARCTGKLLGIPYVDPTRTRPDAGAARLITNTQALQFCAVPIARSATGLTVAMANPLDIPALDQLQRHTGMEIEPVIAAEEDIREAITRVFGEYDDLVELVTEAIHEVGADGKGDGEEGQAAIALNGAEQTAERSPVVRLVNAIIMRATAQRTSDIHINPEKNRVRVRFRVDGMLQEVMTIPTELQNVLISRLKIMAGMDIAERRAPQDGRITLLTPLGEYDLRVSTYPALHGENLVMRILDKRSAQISLERIGLQADLMHSFQELIRQPYGMVLVCGPTGAGKTTTLYASLNALNSADRNIMTIEDPVEYQLPGIIQGNVNPKAGITFATGLRSLVRQDPDIILVGEIRDQETARIAIEAALTGHLVFSTIHANDAAGAITRLADMGVEPFFIASALLCTLAQRLLRLICPKCAAPYTPQPALLASLGESFARETSGLAFRHGVGCEFCNRAGYKGRTGIYELLSITPEVQRLILAQAAPTEIAQAGLLKQRTLRDDALLKLRQGATTPEEVLRVTIM